MARKQFDIKYRPQIESGEYKVETRDGRKARIVHWDLNCTSPIVAVMDAHIDLPGEIVDVFSVSGRAFDDLESPSDLFIVTPEPELSEFELKLLDWLSSDTCGEIPMEKMKKCVKNRGVELLELAKKEIVKQGNIVIPVDDFNERLCVAMGHARKEALKDLPRWEPAARAYEGDRLPRIDWSLNRLVARFEEGIFYLDIRELYKLPRIQGGRKP